MPVQIDGHEDYKEKYKLLKRKLKLLIYESECFQEELRKSQRALLKVRRDKSFLLDRLLQYQRGIESSSDSELTEDSDAENESKQDFKRRRPSLDMNPSNPNVSFGGGKPGSMAKKKKPNPSSGNVANPNSGKPLSNKQISKPGHMVVNKGNPNSVIGAKQAVRSNLSNAALISGGSGGAVIVGSVNSNSDGQMSREELERHLAARQPMNDFTTTVSLTLPNQLFSDNIMDGDFMEEEVDTSPGNLDDDLTVDNYD